MTPARRKPTAGLHSHPRGPARLFKLHERDRRHLLRSDAELRRATHGVLVLTGQGDYAHAADFLRIRQPAGAARHDRSRGLSGAAAEIRDARTARGLARLIELLAGGLLGVLYLWASAT